MLKLQAVSCRLGPRDVLQGVSLSVAPGEVVGLIGPNGAGKSTLIRCAAGLLPISAGRIEVEGQALATWPRHAIARCLAYVPQASGPSMGLSAHDMISLGRLPHRGKSSARADGDIVLESIERLGLGALALRPYAELSGGERQRVLLARALAQQGRLMLLDEPTSALDLRHQLGTLRCLRSLAREGVAVMVALHDLSLAARFCDQLVMLQGGRVHAQGLPRDVLTTDHLARVYGVSALVSEADGHPCVTALEELN